MIRLPQPLRFGNRPAPGFEILLPRSIGGLAFLVVLAAAPAAAQNLVHNARFDTDTSGWTAFGLTTTVTAVRSPDDLHGSSSSGSLSLTNAEPAANAPVGAQQCINVPAGTIHFRGYYHLEANQVATGFVFLNLTAFPTSNCTSAQTTSFNGPLESQAGQWLQTSMDTTLPAGTHSVQASLRVTKTSAGGQYTVHFDEVFFGVPCHQSSSILCVDGNRFGIQAAWRTRAGDSGIGTPIPLTTDTGYFWFFGPANVEVVIKVLDACVVNHRFWVYAGGLTDVKVDLTVTDFETNTVKPYSNPLGRPFQPIQDSSAFATCP